MLRESCCQYEYRRIKILLIWRYEFQVHGDMSVKPDHEDSTESELMQRPQSQWTELLNLEVKWLRIQTYKLHNHTISSNLSKKLKVLKGKDVADIEAQSQPPMHTDDVGSDDDQNVKLSDEDPRQTMKLSHKNHQVLKV